MCGPALRARAQVAYDFDFTIAHYNDSLGFTIYELAKQHLVRVCAAPGSSAR